jgi:hypothetical protein
MAEFRIAAPVTFPNKIVSAPGAIQNGMEWRRLPPTNCRSRGNFGECTVLAAGAE